MAAVVCNPKVRTGKGEARTYSRDFRKSGVTFADDVQALIAALEQGLVFEEKKSDQIKERISI